MDEELNAHEEAIKTTARAAEVAASAAAAAAAVARDVAARATETAASVAALAAKTTESVIVLGTDISYIKKDISEIKQKLEVHYVSQDEFTPVKNIVFGLVGALGLAALAAVARLIFIS